MRPKSLRAALLGAACSILMSGCATEHKSTLPEKPPPPPAALERVTPSPGPQYVWIADRWEWRGRWVRMRGRWMVPPHLYAVWMPGHWAKRPHGYVWISGHWD